MFFYGHLAGLPEIFASSTGIAFSALALLVWMEIPHLSGCWWLHSFSQVFRCLLLLPSFPFLSVVYALFRLPRWLVSILQSIRLTYYSFWTSMILTCTFFCWSWICFAWEVVAFPGPVLPLPLHALPASIAYCFASFWSTDFGMFKCLFAFFPPSLAVKAVWDRLVAEGVRKYRCAWSFRESVSFPFNSCHHSLRFQRCCVWFEPYLFYYCC